jgi:hypothetical protein
MIWVVLFFGRESNGQVAVAKSLGYWGRNRNKDSAEINVLI